MTSDLRKRVWEHKNNVVKGFTYRYNLHDLVFYECSGTIDEALARERQIKGGSRKKKIDLINAMNPEWQDLSEEILKY
jgi:putative endonuclease